MYRSGDDTLLDYLYDWNQLWFEYISEQQFSEDARAKCKADADQLIDIAVSVIQELQPEFTTLDVTEDFIAYVTLHDESSETLAALMRRTVNEEIMQKLLTEV